MQGARAYERRLVPRSSHIPRAFAIQSIAAERAVELGRDQKDVLLELIGAPRRLDWQRDGLPQEFWNHGEPYAAFPIDTGRLRNVIELAAVAGIDALVPRGHPPAAPSSRDAIRNRLISPSYRHPAPAR